MESFENDILLAAVADVKKYKRSEIEPILNKLYCLCVQPKGNAFNQLQQFRKYVPILIDAYIFLNKFSVCAAKSTDDSKSNIERNRNKRWTKEDDETLIEYVCSSDESIASVAKIFGRSPASVQSRITKLVGIERLSKEVAGRFLGTIDGHQISGDIKGIVSKQKG